ncbi:MAG: PKD domain-containing protein [Acidobacteriota bacterium]|nr:PKD domain-containing protein [Acidobacteriota bacterium]
MGFSALAVLALSAGRAQASPGPTQALRIFSEESIISLDKIDAATSANFAPGILAAIRAGALEIRQSVSYDPGQSMLRVTGFVVAPGAPLPTAPSSLPLNGLWSYTAQVSDVRLSSTTRYSIAFVGRVNPGAVTAFGDVGGVSVFASAAYDPATASGAVMQFSSIETNIVGTASLFSATGRGIAQIDTMAVASVPPIAVAGPKGTQTPNGMFQLDGSRSSDPMGGTITYQWTFIPMSGQTVILTGDNTATPSVTIPQNMFAFGDYLFLLRVVNSAGLTSTDTVTVSYSNPIDQ